MSVTTTAPTSILARYHRDERGFPVEYLQEFDPTKNYLHYVEESHDQDPSRATPLCGTKEESLVTEDSGTRRAGMFVCPKCYLEKILRR